MIITITCLYGTLESTDRNEFKRELLSLCEIDSSITRIEVIFTKQNRNTLRPKLVTCHVSIQASNHRHIDIYEHQPSMYESFDKANERALKKIAKTTAINHHLHQSTSLAEKRELVSWNH